ncbi:MAG: SpoIIE family protein phosphatase [Microscillaceae bacterium]|nr:SpoIIE family protein phosphatase [Microscillaceae bacterium]
MGQQFQSRKIAQEASALLARIYARQLDYPRAFQYQTQNMLWRDSLFTEENSRSINNLRESYESEKQTLEIENLKNIQKIQAEENRLQAILLYGSGVALVLISTILLLLYRNYRYNQKITRQIEAQKEEITQIAENLQHANGEISEQKKVIEKKNFDLTSSITYAKRIQEALLPPHEELTEALQNYFVMYRPRDIVSGDFYWVAQKKYKTILAVADCTGHGIPGAFMSMIGNDLLNEIVVGRNITEPDKILEELRRRVRKVLRQQKTKNHDGMDIAICTIEQYPPGYEEILGTPKLEYAGAENSLFYIENENPQLLELKGSKAIIGGFNVLQQDRPFIKHTLLLEPHRLPLTFYLYTDGYQDQFGPKGKFMRRRFRELLSRIHPFDLPTQKEMVEQTINDWLGDHAQIDDMLVMGVKIKGQAH